MRERGQGRTPLQTRFAATANKLEYLHQEFDFANAPRPELDIVDAVASRHLAANLSMQLAQLRHRAVIQITPKHERFDQCGQFIMANAGNGPCLDPSIALPRAALGDEIHLQRRKADGQCAAFSIGPQAHIDTEYESIGGDIGDRGDDLFADVAKELMVAHYPRAVGFALLRIDKDQIDIG